MQPAARDWVKKELFVDATGRDFPVFFRGLTVAVPPSTLFLHEAVGTLL